MRTVGALLFLMVAVQAQDFGPSAAEIDDYVYEDSTRKFKRVETEETARTRWDFEIRVGLWIPDLDGPIAVSGQRNLDLEDVFGLDDTELAGTLSFRAVRNDSFIIEVAMIQVSYEGVQTVQTSFTLGGQTFDVDQQIVTDLDLFSAGARLGWCVYNPSRHVTIGVYISLALINIGGQVTSRDQVSGNIETAPFDLTLPLPTLGAAIWGELGGGFIYSARIDGIGISLASDSEWLDAFGGAAWNAEASIGYNITERVFVTVGYRYAEVAAFLENIQGSVTIEFSLRGVFFEVGYRF